MISVRKAKVLANQAWETGVYIQRAEYYSIVLPDEESIIRWKMRNGKVWGLKINPYFVKEA